MSAIFSIQFAITLLCTLTNAQVGGIGLGVFGGVGLAVLASGFHFEPTSPSIDVMLMIMVAISAAVSMQASGGSDYMTKITTRVLYCDPKYIISIAPAVTYPFTVLADMEHVVYSVLFVIAKVSRCNGIRPPRPLTMAVIASQLAIIASPIAVVVVVCVTYLELQHVTVADVLKVTVLSIILGIGLVRVSVNKLGRELKDDPHHQKLLAKPGYVKAHEKDPTEHINLTVSPQAKSSVGISLTAVLLVAAMGAVPELCPTFQMEGGPKLMGMAHTIETAMLSAVALIILLYEPDDNAITRGSVFHAGMRVVIAAFGVAWLGDTLMHGHLAGVKDIVLHSAETTPQTFAAALFVLFVLVNSQDATVATLFPTVISLNIPAPVIIGTFVAANGYLFIPNYGPIIATTDFDSMGSAKIGKYTFNHNSMIPGLLSFIFSLISGLMFAEMLLQT